MKNGNLVTIAARAIFAMVCVGFVCQPACLAQVVSGQDKIERQAEDSEVEQTRLLIQQILDEGITQADLESSTPVMQDLNDGKITEQVAAARLKRFGDGKLVKFLSNRLFRLLFRRADPTEIFRSLRERGFNTSGLEELQSSINFYFRPQTEIRTAQWEYVSNTLFIPSEFSQPGTNQVRTDLFPHQVNTLIHELDHAEKDLRFDLLRMRGKSLWGKVHAGICWGGIACLLGLILTTTLGSLHRLQRFLPITGRLSRLAILGLPQTALGVVFGATVVGVAVALLYHFFSPTEYSDLRKLEQENELQITRIAEIIEMTALDEDDREMAARAQGKAIPWQIREAVRFGVPGALGGAALGLLLGWLGLGPRMLGQLRILKALSYPWAMGITCGLIGAISLASFGAWRTNQFSKIKAWEISAYYSGHCVQQILEAQQDIAFQNTRLLYSLSLDELYQLRTLDERGSLKLLLPRRWIRLPDSQHDRSAAALTQLATKFPGGFKRFGVVGSEFQAYLGVPIEFPYRDHPQVFESLFRTTLGLDLDKLTTDRVRNEVNYRGLADFMERSELPFYVQIRDQVRQARAARIRELTLRQTTERE